MRTLAVTTLTLALLLAPLQAAEIPRQSPEFVIYMPTGAQTLVSQHRGKVVLLEFLLTTCPHCQKASQIMQKLYKEYGPRGFQPLGIAINDMAKMLVPDYVKQFQLTYPVGFSLRDPVYNYLQHPAIMQLMMPTIVFIDRQGKIRAQHMGNEPFFQDEEKNMRALIESLLKDPAATRSKAPATPKKTS